MIRKSASKIHFDTHWYSSYVSLKRDKNLDKKATQLMKGKNKKKINKKFACQFKNHFM